MVGKPIFPLIVVLLAVFIAVMVWVPAIPQDLAYHNFADESARWGIANIWNTLSNLPFIVAGSVGLLAMARENGRRFLPSMRSAYTLLFVGSILVGLGSGYYHLAPDNRTLIWDRLPMTLAFMSLFAVVLAEFVDEGLGKAVFWPAVVLGALSVVYWAWSESAQRGDLRPYAIVQFLPMLIMPLVILSGRSRFTDSSGYWWLLLCYLLAKAAEHYDREIFSLLSVVSGHSLKHVLAALGLLVLVRSYRRRKPV